jgi:hypothetical protein
MGNRVSSPWDIWGVRRTAGSPDARSTDASGDRRTEQRYPVHAELSYSVTSRRQIVQSGQGRTLDISGNAVLFEAESELPQGARIELSIPWPGSARSTRIELQGHGSIVRSGDGYAVARIDHYSFVVLQASSIED